MSRRKYDKNYHPKTPWNDWEKEVPDGMGVCIVCGKISTLNGRRRCNRCSTLTSQCRLKVSDIRKYSIEEYEDAYKYTPIADRQDQQQRAWGKVFVQSLKDRYVANILKLQGIAPSAEAIETYRGIIRLRRTIKSAKYITADGLNYQRCPRCEYYYHNVVFTHGYCTPCHRAYSLNWFRNTSGKELLTEDEEISRRISWLDEHPEVKILQL